MERPSVRRSDGPRPLPRRLSFHDEMILLGRSAGAERTCQGQVGLSASNGWALHLTHPHASARVCAAEAFDAVERGSGRAWHHGEAEAPGAGGRRVGRAGTIHGLHVLEEGGRTRSRPPAHPRPLANWCCQCCHPQVDRSRLLPSTRPRPRSSVHTCDPRRPRRWHLGRAVRR